MKYYIEYCKWKNLWTKDILSNTVTWHFTASTECWFSLQKNFNKVLKLDVEWRGIVNQFDCSINTESKKPLSFDNDECLIKLDILLPDVSLLWTILSGNLYILIWENDNKD